MGNVSDDDTQTIETMFSTISTFEIGLNNRQNQMSTLMEHIMKGRNEKNNVGTAGDSLAQPIYEKRKNTAPPIRVRGSCCK